LGTRIERPKGTRDASLKTVTRWEIWKIGRSGPTGAGENGAQKAQTPDISERGRSICEISLVMQISPVRVLQCVAYKAIMAKLQRVPHKSSRSGGEGRPGVFRLSQPGLNP
jgi:hypothetical protein